MVRQRDGTWQRSRALRPRRILRDVPALGVCYRERRRRRARLGSPTADGRTAHHAVQHPKACVHGRASLFGPATPRASESGRHPGHRERVEAPTQPDRDAVPAMGYDGCDPRRSPRGQCGLCRYNINNNYASGEATESCPAHSPHPERMDKPGRGGGAASGARAHARRHVSRRGQRGGARRAGATRPLLSGAATSGALASWDICCCVAGGGASGQRGVHARCAGRPCAIRQLSLCHGYLQDTCQGLRCALRCVTRDAAEGCEVPSPACWARRLQRSDAQLSPNHANRPRRHTWGSRARNDASTTHEVYISVCALWEMRLASRREARVRAAACPKRRKADALAQSAPLASSTPVARVA
jgi:hypothetical protein